MSSFWNIVAHIRDLASAVTPIAVVVLGIYINRTIQNQNKIAERRSALTKQWADEFSRLVDEVYNTSVRVFILYFQASHEDLFVTTEKAKFYEDMNSEVRQIALSLYQQKMYLEKFVDLAPRTGSAFDIALTNLHNEVRSWFAAKGGNADKFRNLRATFNQSARDTHREILQLDGEP